MRPFTVIASIILAVLAVVLALQHYQRAAKVQQSLYKERYERMLAEEQLERAKGKINSMESEIGKVELKLGSLEKTLQKAKTDNQNLKMRLDEADKLKQDLQAQIKEINPVLTNAVTPGEL